MYSVTLKNLSGSFNSGDIISNSRSVSALVIETNNNIINITDPEGGEFKPNDVLTGLNGSATIQSISETSPLDLFSLFGDKLPIDFSFANYIENLPIDKEIPSNQDFDKITETESDENYPTVAFPPDPEQPKTVPNPVQPGKESPIRPDTRIVQNIANEPTYENNSKYPYNKSYQSESGHLKEIDDTPGYERLLDQHACGTYQEMHADGNMVTKVVNDKYTIVAGDGFVTIEGQALVYVMGDCNLRVGGATTLTSEGGVNVSTKGAFRVKAKTINMESTGGDVTVKSSQNITTTATDKYNIKAKSNHIDSAEMTSVISGQQFIVEAQKISAHSASDVAIAADGETYISSKADSNFTAAGSVYLQAAGDANIKAGGPVAVSGSSLEVDATLNVQGATNLKGIDPQGGFVEPIEGQGSSSAGSAADASLEVGVPAAESKGSGITYSANPDAMMMEVDDDPELAAAAIKKGIENGTIDPKELDEPVTEGQQDGASGEKDVEPSGDAPASLNKPTIGDVGSRPNDNLRLSPNFTVGKLSKHTPAGSHTVKAQHGLTASQIVGNMQLLAVNCLEKIKERYPDMQVTSCFRSSTGGKSQHERGMAADMQFARANKNKAEYYEIAKWIKANVPHDQLLLEYKTTGSKLPWIHISFNSKGNRKQVLTLKNHRTFGQGLIQLA